MFSLFPIEALPSRAACSPAQWSPGAGLQTQLSPGEPGGLGQVTSISETQVSHLQCLGPTSLTQLLSGNLGQVLEKGKTRYRWKGFL